MSRKVFDRLTSAGGVVAVVVLLVAGGLLTWGHSFVNSNVHNQLAQQQVYFPPAAAFAHPKAGTEITPSMIPSVSQYAGQQLLTGAQAKVYADNFIAVHLSEMPYGGVYSKISAAALASTREPSRCRHSCRPRSAGPRCAVCCSRRTPSPRSARSCSGARSPHSPWPWSCPSSSRSASLTLAGQSPRSRCSPPRWAPPPPETSSDPLGLDAPDARAGHSPVRASPVKPARARGRRV